MVVAEITRRHHTELAVTWWRRETSPVLLLRGQPDTFVQLDSKIEAYMEGAGLDTASMFEYLLQHQNPGATDFVADMVAAFLASSIGGAGARGKAWYDSVQSHPQVDQAVQGAMRWLGRTSVLPQQCESDDVPAWHGPQHLRFINGLGEVCGHFISGNAMQPSTAVTPLATAVSKLCSASLVRAPDDYSTQWLAQARAEGMDLTAQIMAAGLSGQAKWLPSMLDMLSTRPDALLPALDAVRRITGFDALQTVQAERQAPHAIGPEQLSNAKTHAQQWLTEHMARFQFNVRYLLGQPISVNPQATKAHLQDIVLHGYQADREVAAMHFYLSPQPCLLPVRSRSSVQQRFFAQHFN